MTGRLSWHLPLSLAASTFPWQLKEGDSFQVLSRTALITEKSGDPFAPWGSFWPPGALGREC